MTNVKDIKGFKEQLFSHLSKFSPQEKILFDRIFKIYETTGELVPPKEMYPWIIENFGSVESVVKQDFIKITNHIMYEGSVFNELRMKRPQIKAASYEEILAEIQKSIGGPFSDPLKMTPADTFGRIKGKYCITASNIAKYDGLHGVIIYDDPNPLLFTRERIRDYFDVARKWFVKAHESKRKAVYPILTWNCLWKAGASIIHGHSQLAITEGQAYSRIEKLRYLSLRYQEKYRTNYFDDVYQIHKKLGLALERDQVKLIVKITPVKEKEIAILAPRFNDTLADMVSDTLQIYREKMGVMSFNLVVILPPMEYTAEVWQHVPIIVFIVDRGSLENKGTDFASSEIYAQSIIGSNPYNVFDNLRRSL